MLNFVHGYLYFCETITFDGVTIFIYSTFRRYIYVKDYN